MRRRRWTWGRWAFIAGLRSGEWWIGGRRNFPMDMVELNVLGVTLMVGRR